MQGQLSADGMGKLTHAEVHYRVGQGAERCSACKHFDGPNNCELVQPPIYPAGDCDKFQPAGALAPNDATAVPGAAGPAGALPAPPPPISPVNTMAHGRAIAGARALHAVGHISRAERDKHISKSRQAIRKPFGSFSP